MSKKMAKLCKMVVLVTLFFVGREIVFAADVNLTVRDGSSVVFTGPVSIPTSVTALNDATSTPHTIDANSVLAVLDSAATGTGSNFNISNLTYFSSFGSLYVKCITDTGGEKCDNWQYTVNGAYPSLGMDKNILSGGENVYVYFGPQNRITLSGDTITTDDALTATAQTYDYQNDTWLTRTGVTIGLTQPNPSDQFNPIEVTIKSVDTNGQALFSAIPAGSYNVGIKEDFYFPTESLTVTVPPTLPAHHHSSGGGGGDTQVEIKTGSVLGAETKLKFDYKKAFDFLVTQQKSDGSFGEDLYTDWSAVALASGNYQANTIKLIKHLTESKTDSSLLTDYERHAMALLALGLNPYSTNGENYVEKIVAGFDGKQFGDLHEDNDDIFALIILQNTGFTQNEKMISDDINFVLSAQRENGSWDESVDMTGAAMEALSTFSQNEQVKSALVKAKEFLRQTQKDDGSWGDNASSTAWALEGITALGEKPEDWVKSDNTPFDYFATIQDTDGGIKTDTVQNKIWETAYVIKAYSNKTWNGLMQKFEKPADAGAVLGTSTEIKPNSIPKKTIAKVKKQIPAPVKIENTATVVNTLGEATTPEPTPKQENWFMRLLHFIF